MPYHRKLPDGPTLIKDRYVARLTLTEIAQKYDVAKSTVSEAFTRIGRPWGGNIPVDYRAILPWPIERQHQALDAALRLKAHIKAHHAIELKPDAARRLSNWYGRLRRESVVLDYQPASAPWVYLQRKPEDGELLIRWPEDTPINERQRAALTLPAGD